MTMRIRATTAAKAARIILAKLDKGLVSGGAYVRYPGRNSNVRPGEKVDDLGNGSCSLGSRCAIGWLATKKQAHELENVDLEGRPLETTGNYPLVAQMLSVVTHNSRASLTVPEKDQMWFIRAQALADCHDYANLRKHCEKILA